MTEQGAGEQQSASRPRCGVIMPISAIGGLLEQHWAEVFDILRESIESAGFELNMVSAADDSGVIQKRVIQNLFENPIAVCDLSARNPNVMFELGMGPVRNLVSASRNG